MTQVYMEDVTLKELIQITSFIIVGRKTVPFEIREIIDITPPGKSADKDRYPDFTKIKYNFQITEVIYKKDNGHDQNEKTIEVGTKIEISPAEQDLNLEMHKKYYLDGEAKSWESRNYNTTAGFNHSEELILFLNVTGQNSYCFAVGNAYETLDRIKEISDMVKQLDSSH